VKPAVLDTNVYVDWLSKRARPELVTGARHRLHLSAVVVMELRVGARSLPARRAVQRLLRAYQKVDRVVVPTATVLDTAGITLQRLADRGMEIRRASLSHDVLIALSARSIGATLLTRDRDYEAIREVVDFDLELIG